MRRCALVTLVLLTTGMTPLRAHAAEGLATRVRQILHARSDAAVESLSIGTDDETTLLAPAGLREFYTRRVFEPAWSSDHGLLPQADSLLLALSRADREGLRPWDYGLAAAELALNEIHREQLAKRALRPERVADLDLLLTSAFLAYGEHLLGGRVDPGEIDPEWQGTRRTMDLGAVLETALAANRIQRSLSQLLPVTPGYARLKSALVAYRHLAAQGGWPSIPAGPKLQCGDRDERVPALRARLLYTAELPDTAAGAELFDSTLAASICAFQARHGLAPDGVVGPLTLAALNASAPERVRQIELNMERLRWLPSDLGERYVFVNVADFRLEVIERGQVVLGMRAVVGRDYRRTPVFSDRMTYLVLNPSWHVPRTIALEDMVPQMRKDPEYLAKHHIRMLRGSGQEVREIDPGTIDWAAVDPDHFPYHLRQDPGPANLLGRIKFVFPNRFDVYLHDTPSRSLFARSERTFSSGCIRIEKPLELADYLLRGDPQWTPERLRAALDKKTEQTVVLSRSIPVHVVYWTAWVADDGSVQFRSDVYGRDRVLDAAMGATSSTLTIPRQRDDS